MEGRWEKARRAAAACYLSLAGWAFLLLPWSELWPQLLHLFPPPCASLLGKPAVRGALSGFGLAHFVSAASWLHPKGPRS
ncbi:MAG: hypothetical protein NZ869_02545 [Thermoanaerobaculum sp.]|nr:hypothetical protein [Thermoanaerobaculum sp.]MDW7967358.1 hypothetical protein [Thermoanaerobaculum sp.]